jgi:hypothetical protein
VALVSLPHHKLVLSPVVTNFMKLKCTRLEWPSLAQIYKRFRKNLSVDPELKRRAHTHTQHGDHVNLLFSP